MASIYRRKDNPYYWVDYKDSCGRRRAMSTHTTSKRLANEIRHQKELEEVKSKHNLLEYGESSIADFCDRYLKWIQDRKRYETYKTYRGVLKLFREFLQTRPGIKKLKDIDIVTIEDYLSYLAKDHKRYTLNNHLKALKSMINIAIDWRYLTDNPCKRVKPLELTDKKPIVWLTDDKYNRFMKVCHDEFSDFFPVFYTFIHTGMRSGELFNLKWEDVDLIRKIIHIRQKEGFIPKGKSNATHEAKHRVIPIHDSLVDVLKSIKHKSEYIFVDKDGDRFSKHKPRRTLMRIAKRAEIAGLTRLHELRHTFASQLVVNGVNIYKVKELLGHSDIRDTMRYSHLAPENMRDDLKVLERLDIGAVSTFILQENSVPA